MQMKSFMLIISIEFILLDHVKIVHWKNNFIGRDRFVFIWNLIFYENRWTYVNSISEIICLSCNESCDYASAQFSIGKGNYYILECFGSSIPYSILYNRTKKLGNKKNEDCFVIFWWKFVFLFSGYWW
jgi:hypothetical protein